MRAEFETMAQVQTIASWRVAVTQGLTLLGFKDWVMQGTHCASAACDKDENHRLARVASDEFLVVLTADANQREAARCVASSIIASSENSLPEPDLGRALAGSLGIALFPNHAADAAALSLAADRQRYEARRQGRDAISF